MKLTAPWCASAWRNVPGAGRAATPGPHTIEEIGDEGIAEARRKDLVNGGCDEGGGTHLLADTVGDHGQRCGGPPENVGWRIW